MEQDFFKLDFRDKFNLAVQMSKQESINSSLVVTWYLVSQIIFLGLYSILIYAVIKLKDVIGPLLVTNVVLWCYVGLQFNLNYLEFYFQTYTYACMFLPIIILASTKIISLQRREKINGLTKENQNENQKSYFDKLDRSWSQGYGNRYALNVPAPVVCINSSWFSVLKLRNCYKICYLF